MSSGRVEQEMIITDIHPPPYCIHGPTLLFRRYYTDQPSRSFYACSVHRSRKGCQFFHYLDQPLSDEKREQYKLLFKQHQLSLISSQTVSLSSSIIPSSCFSFCTECSLLYRREDKESDVHHTHHVHRDTLTDSDLLHPTTLLYPRSDNKGQAQYFFSNETQSFLISELKRLSITHVICMGTPKFYEVLPDGIKRYLLDIDHRYCQFYGRDVFQRFNMFNGFFYSSEDEEGKESISAFIKSVPKRNILLIVDPPFGGLVSALKSGMSVIWNLIGEECTTFLIFPYFNESHVLESFPNFHMSDYQVTYGNHRYYGVKGKRGRPSPVRIFTNLSLPGLILPLKDGYKYCHICNRYVSLLNQHCTVCDKCTSKDGRVYRHCNDCGTCVKKGTVHCLTCNSCHSSDYNCQIKNKTGCYICGGEDHKKLHCPSRGSSERIKRKKKNKPTTNKKPKK